VRCDVCLGNHWTDSHLKLEQTFERYERWGIGWGTQISLALDGEHGAPSPSDLPKSANAAEPGHVGTGAIVSEDGGGILLPDHLRIGRCTIGGIGWDAESLPGAAILRLWKKDVAGGFTFMLSCDRLLGGGDLVPRKAIWRSWFDRFGRCEIQPYDVSLGASHYISKYLTKSPEHWDLRRPSVVTPGKRKHLNLPPEPRPT